MTQNIYDRADFFVQYSQLPRSIQGISAHGTPEWPVLSSLLPSVRGARFLDLGCGYGWYCRWARDQGAAAATGIDVSEKMLVAAQERTQDAAITYLRADLESLALPPRAYDVVFSSLALHYVRDLAPLVRQVYETLEPGGAFVFSVEHPMFTAPRRQEWIKDSEGRDVWPLDRYLEEGERTTKWLGHDDVVKYHRMTSTYVTILLTAGFVLSAMVEWGPTLEQIENGLDWAKTRDRPPFLMLKALKPVE
jgi:SAM-dependent methyltransferase